MARPHRKRKMTPVAAPSPFGEAFDWNNPGR
jgi:hypothetical protein